jgi:pilus assembly protein CpaF
MPEPFVVAPRRGMELAERRAAPPAPVAERDVPARFRAGRMPREAEEVRLQAESGSPSLARADAAAPPPVADTALVDLCPALEPFRDILSDPAVTDLFVNGADGLFIDRGAGTERVAGWRATDEDVRELAVSLIGAGGRHLDDAAPCVDVRLEGGVRVHAVLPPIASSGTVISLRVPRLGAPSLDDLARRGMFEGEARARLDAAVASRENLLISGAAGAGKTTLLAALLSSAPHADRIVTIEDVAELRLEHPHHVRLESRQPNLEGAGGVGLARLVREALRMRPDRLVVGECRGEEVRELLSALNTGHDGGAGTVHANGLHEVPARLEALGALAGLDDQALARQVVSAIDLVLHVSRDHDGVRRLAEFGRPALDDRGRLKVVEES